MAVGEIENAPVAKTSPFTAMWFLKRLVLALGILIISFGGLAWLTHAAIDPGAGPQESLIDALARLSSNF